MNNSTVIQNTSSPNNHVSVVESTQDTTSSVTSMIATISCETIKSVGASVAIVGFTASFTAAILSGSLANPVAITLVGIALIGTSAYIGALFINLALTSSIDSFEDSLNQCNQCLGIVAAFTK